MLIPNFSKGGVKDFCVYILGEEWPLTAKKIYNKLKKNGISVTYQAVFKTLQELVREKVLTKNEMTYEINMAWASYLNNFSEKIKTNYLMKNKSFVSGVEISKVVYYFDPRVIRFIEKTGDKVYEFIKKDEAIIFVLSGSYYFGCALKNYLENMGKVVDCVELDRNKLDIYENDARNKKIVIVDAAIYSGETYRRVIEKLHNLQNKINILDIKYVVEYDMVGLADWSCEGKKLEKEKSIIIA